MDIVVAILLSIGIGVSLFLGIKSLLQTERLQEKQVKLVQERIKSEQAKEMRESSIGLLNEISKWAVDTLRIGMPTQSVILVSSLDNKSERRLLQNALITLRNDFRVSNAVSIYIRRTGLAFGEKLKSSINTLDTDIRKQDELIGEHMEMVNRQATREFEKAWDELIDNWNKISESAAKVIDEAINEKFTILNI